MDPLSVTASLIALLTLSGQIGSTITGLIKDTKTAPAELVEIDREVRLLNLVLRRLQVLVDEELASNGSAIGHCAVKKVDPYFSAPNLEIAMSACRAAMQEIGVKAVHVESLMRGGPLDRITYPFSWQSVKKGLRELRTRLEYSKISILMSLQLRTLGAMKAACQTSANSEAAIRELLLEVQALRAQQESQRDGDEISWQPMEQPRSINPQTSPTQPLGWSPNLPDAFVVNDVQNTFSGDLDHPIQPTATTSEHSPTYILDNRGPSVPDHQAQRSPLLCYERKSPFPNGGNPMVQEIEICQKYEGTT